MRVVAKAARRPPAEWFPRMFAAEDSWLLGASQLRAQQSCPRRVWRAAGAEAYKPDYSAALLSRADSAGVTQERFVTMTEVIAKWFRCSPAHRRKIVGRLLFADSYNQ